MRIGPPLVGALPTFFCALLCVGLVLWQVLLHPGVSAVGGRASEGPLHLWSLWVAAEGLWEHGPFVRVAPTGFPLGFQSHLMDPINLVVFAPVYALAGGGADGAILAWNALYAAAVLIGAWGTWRLGSRLAAGHPAMPWATALLCLAFCASPKLLRAPDIGRTESLPAMLYPWHLSLLLAWLRVPPGLAPSGLSPAPRWTVGLGAGLTLGAMALGGWYLAVFAAFLNVPLGLWLARRLPWREAAWRLAMVAGVSLLCVAPAALALARYPATHGGVFASDWAPTEITHRTFRVFGVTEALRLDALRELQPWLDHVPYLGVVSLLLGVVGAWRFAAARVWLAFALYILLLTLGPLTLPSWEERLNLDRVELIKTPLYYLLQAVPVLREIHYWGRLAWLGALAAGVGALYGLIALAGTRPRAAPVMALGLGALVLADHLTWPERLTLPRATFEVRMPQGLTEALAAVPEGPIVQVPLAEQAMLRGQVPRSSSYLLWQPQHGRPISARYADYADYSTSSDFGRMLFARQRALEKRQAAGDNLDLSALGALAIGCGRRGLAELREQGYAAVVLHVDDPVGAALYHDLELMLGAPAHTGGTVIAWSLARLPPAGLRVLVDGACDSVQSAALGG